MVSETLGKKMKHAVVSLVATIMAMGTLISFAPSADVYAAGNNASKQPGCYYFLGDNALRGLGFTDGAAFRKEVVNTIMNKKISGKWRLYDKHRGHTNAYVYGSGCIDFVMRTYYSAAKAKGGAKFGTSAQIAAAKKALKMFEDGGTTYKGCSYFMSDKELRSVCGVSSGKWQTIKLGGGSNESTLAQALKRLGAERGDIIMLSNFTVTSTSYTCRVTYTIETTEEVLPDIEPDEDTPAVPIEDDSEENDEESGNNEADGDVDGGVSEEIPDFEDGDETDNDTESDDDVGDDPVAPDDDDVDEVVPDDEPTVDIEPIYITHSRKETHYFYGYGTAKKAKAAAQTYINKLKAQEGVKVKGVSYTTYKVNKGTKGAHPWKHTAIFRGTYTKDNKPQVWMANYDYKKQWGTEAYNHDLTNYGAGKKAYNHVLIFKASGTTYKPTYHAGSGKLIAKQEYDDLVAAYGEQYVQEHITFTAKADVTVEVIDSLGADGKCNYGNGDDTKHTVTAGNEIWSGNLTDATRKTVTIDGVQYYEFTLSITKVRLALPDTDVDKSIKVTVTETTDFDALKH